VALGLGAIVSLVAVPSPNPRQGPELLSAGPYRPITIRTYINHLANVTTHACVSADLKSYFALDISLSSANGSNIQDGSLKVDITMRDPKGAVVREEWVKVHSVDAGTVIKDFVEWTFEKEELALWWPVGYGAPVLYEVEVVLMDAEVRVQVHMTSAKTDRLLRRWSSLTM
jgi:beta-mannosidase